MTGYPMTRQSIRDYDTVQTNWFPDDIMLLYTPMRCFTSYIVIRGTSRFGTRCVAACDDAPCRLQDVATYCSVPEAVTVHVTYAVLHSSIFWFAIPWIGIRGPMAMLQIIEQPAITFKRDKITTPLAKLYQWYLVERYPNPKSGCILQHTAAWTASDFGARPWRLSTYSSSVLKALIVNDLFSECIMSIYPPTRPYVRPSIHPSHPSQPSIHTRIYAHIVRVMHTGCQCMCRHCCSNRMCNTYTHKGMICVYALNLYVNVYNIQWHTHTWVDTCMCIYIYI